MPLDGKLPRYIVTGGAGFIGSNIIHGLNAHGIADILIVDNLFTPRNFVNLTGRAGWAPSTSEFRGDPGGSLGADKIEAEQRSSTSEDTRID